MNALKVSLLVFTFGLLGLPLTSAAHGGYGYYAPPPVYGYVPAPIYPAPYGRPLVVTPYGYGGGHYAPPPRHGFRRHQGWRDYRGGYRGWNGGPYGGGYHRGPRSGFSFYYSD
jgi:hypothetical protein